MNKDKLKDQLIKHEGIRLRSYVDTVGKVTIGVGHNLTDKGLTKDQVLFILDGDIEDTTYLISTHLSWALGLDDVRLRAIYDLVFNMGAKFLEFKNTIALMQAGKWDEAAAALLQSHYAAQVGKRAQDIAYMLKTGQDPS